MPIKLIKGETYGVVREAVAEQLKNNLSLENNNFLVVPEDLTNVAKEEFARILGVQSIFGLKVLSFLGLANELLPRTNKMLSAEQGLMIFKSVAEREKENLKSFASVIGDDGAMRELFELLNILQESNISSSSLKKAGAKLGGILGAKAMDIALLQEKYYLEIEDVYCDKHTQMKSLAEWFLQMKKPCDCSFYLCDFGLMTAEQLEVLKSIAVSGNNLTIGAVTSETADNKRIIPRFLMDFCKKMSCEFGIDVQVEERRYLDDNDKKLLLSSLFGYSVKSYGKPFGDIKVFSAENTNLEVKGVCRMIRQLVVEHNVRYKDISILCQDLKTFEGNFEKEFEIFEIPYFLRSNAKLETFAIARLLLDAIGVIKSGFQKGKIVAFSKNILFSMPKDEVCKFELFVNKYNLDSQDFLVEFKGVKGESLLEAANNVRQKLMDILSCLNCNVYNATEAVQAINNFFERVFEQKDYQNYLDVLQQKYGVKAKRNAELAMDKVFDILQKAESVNLQTPIDIFDSIVFAIKNAGIGAGKRYIDNVFITSNPKEIATTKYLFVMGANDGVIAPDCNSISLFTYSELEKLAEQNINFCPNIIDINYNSKFEAVQLLAKGEQVYVSSNQELGEPAIIVKNICELLGIKTTPLVCDVNKINLNNADYAMKIGTKSNAKRELAMYYSERMRGIASGDENIFDYLYTNLEGEFKYQNLTKQKDFEYVMPNTLGFSKSADKAFASISALERYFDCPFKFYCEKMLKLKKAQDGGLDVMAIGSFVHRILEKIFRKYKKFDMSDEQLFDIVEKLCLQTITEPEFEVLSICMSQNVLKNSLFKKVHHIAEKLVQIAKRTSFETVSTELTFGFEYSKLPPYEIKLEDKSYFIRGKIDRIDKFGDYVAIIDYKTSSSVSYSLKEVYYGERVQLLVYLNAYLSNFNQQPFALFYMPLPYSYSSDEEGKAFAYTGFVRDAQSVFEKFDSEYQDRKKSVIPFSYKRNGEISEKSLLSNKDFEVLREYADKVVVQAIKEIESGYIEPKPTDCAGCEYGEICLNKYNPSRKRKKLSKTVFSLTEEKEENNGENKI